MKIPGKKEKFKISTKPKYCPFIGSISYDKSKPVPKKVQCPVCKRRLEPHISTCTGGREDVGFACCVNLRLNKHRMKH